MREARERLKYSQKELGKAVGLTQPSIAQIETVGGGRGGRVSSPAVIPISRILKIPPPPQPGVEELEARWNNAGRTLLTINRSLFMGLLAGAESAAKEAASSAKKERT